MSYKPKILNLPMKASYTVGRQIAKPRGDSWGNAAVSMAILTVRLTVNSCL